MKFDIKVAATLGSQVVCTAASPSTQLNEPAAVDFNTEETVQLFGKKSERRSSRTSRRKLRSSKSFFDDEEENSEELNIKEKRRSRRSSVRSHRRRRRSSSIARLFRMFSQGHTPSRSFQAAEQFPAVSRKMNMIMSHFPKQPQFPMVGQQQMQQPHVFGVQGSSLYPQFHPQQAQFQLPGETCAPQPQQFLANQTWAAQTIAQMQVAPAVCPPGFVPVQQQQQQQTPVCPPGFTLVQQPEQQAAVCPPGFTLVQQQQQQAAVCPPGFWAAPQPEQQAAVCPPGFTLVQQPEQQAAVCPPGFTLVQQQQQQAPVCPPGFVAAPQLPFQSQAAVCPQAFATQSTGLCTPPPVDRVTEFLAFEYKKKMSSRRVSSRRERVKPSTRSSRKVSQKVSRKRVVEADDASYDGSYSNDSYGY